MTISYEIRDMRIFLYHHSLVEQPRCEFHLSYNEGFPLSTEWEEHIDVKGEAPAYDILVAFPCNTWKQQLTQGSPGGKPFIQMSATYVNNRSRNGAFLTPEQHTLLEQYATYVNPVKEIDTGW